MVKMEPLTQWRPQDIGNVETEQQQICSSTTLLPREVNLVVKLCMVGKGRALGEDNKWSKI